MRTLYYAPMSCSLAVSILLRELDEQARFERVDLASQTLMDGTSYASVNPKMQVPALKLDGSEMLTEVGPILMHLAAEDPHLRFVARPGTPTWRRQAEWLSFLSGELHKAVFYVIYHPSAPEEAKAHARSIATRPLGILAEHLTGRPWLTDVYSVPDILLGVLLCWSEPAGIGLERWPELVRYRAELLKRPAFRSALLEERVQYESAA